mmetsp:Transcript_131867/g.328792  ORF Transcript_131867/g.328792 Transcript_131867/m.328792 type:complete len:606 (-) Transcript_131867:297-2114(-)
MSYSDDFRAKMAEQGLRPEFIEGWVALYEKFCAGDKGFIPESTIQPVTELPTLDSLQEVDESLLARTVVLKLNGGLGTGMGLDKAKSLLEVKNGDTFLDLIAKQILQLRQKYPVRFMLMNSFSTEDDTREFFQKYPEIAEAWDQEVSFMQNMSPKVDAATKQPVTWPEKPSCEWCPPGHGDIYAALVCSGKLEQLLAEGYEYVFVSNSDNLGATLDLKILTYLAMTDSPMIMEVCVRGEDDKKGGHLAQDIASGQLTLRESAQCPKEDEKAFQDITKHKFFNTNNLWLNLRHLQAAMANGVLPLPLIMNEKKVDPSSKENPGPKVYQLETAMGAAISCLPGSTAIEVPFDRFAPVKTCNQLFGLRSDAYVISSEFTPVLAPGACKPIVDFDDNYKMVPDMEAAVPHGVPSLKNCKKVKVKGKVVFGKGCIIEGEVEIYNTDKSAPVPTVTGHIRGSANKLRILRDADDTQSHVAHSVDAMSARGGYVTRLAPQVAGAPSVVRTALPTAVSASGVSLTGTTRAFTVPVTTATAPAPILTAAQPQVVKTISGQTVGAPQIVRPIAPAPVSYIAAPGIQAAAPARYVYVSPGTPVAAQAPIAAAAAAP